LFENVPRQESESLRTSEKKEDEDESNKPYEPREKKKETSS